MIGFELLDDRACVVGRSVVCKFRVTLSLPQHTIEQSLERLSLIIQRDDERALWHVSKF